MNTLRLAGYELRRFLRSRLTTAAVVVLAVIPLLYGALYLYAFWDPYGRLDHIPAALVVQDSPAEAADGTTVRAGQDLADELIDREVFDWHVVDAAAAERGLRDGKYQIELLIPAGFSKDLATAPDADSTPRTAQLSAVSDDATNYLSGVFARTAFDEVRAAAASSASARYFDQMLIGFTDLKKQTSQAADAAGKVRDGSGKLEGGAGRVAGGIDDAEAATGKLANGIDRAGSGADRLADGLKQLESGTSRIASGTAEAARGTRQLADVVDGAADRIEPVLRENARTIEEAADDVAAGASALAKNVGAIDDAADRAVADARKLRGYLDSLPDETPGVGDARELADTLVTDAERIQARIDAADLDALRARLTRVAADARAVADAAPHLAGDVRKARTRVDALANGLDELATGAKKLDTATGTLYDGATDLRGGIFKLSSGARQIDDGLATLSDGGHQVASGLTQLTGGADRLADGLTDGAGKIPAYTDTSERAGVLADPVSLDRVVRHPAATYGVGFAPYFLALALWVGAMINYMLLRPLNRRYLASGAPPHRVALAGLLPGVAIGGVQATLLYLVVRFGLGLSPVHPVTTFGLMLGTAAVFAAIIQLLGAALGPVGRVAALVLLMLQLTSSGGTYPVQTSPGFFQAVHPLLPMTYVVESMRHAIDGGSSATVTHAALILAGFGLVATLLTVVLAGRQRRMRAADLHPELVL
ncbi:putative ABC transporter permease protein [Actinoplanes missouriensis 431]|uniref:Putative ABC transporter permease protein n=1 Tax=Actinoplanes missouriensis (strain ATCC 14538 / DSM 43046 / CBS 188.64 / JCM 3121 / NBRC 102363 / NCIMB 12654 / NRRL B-3342 / UNCC 431) TaxID=512565 RepID=I0HGR9_ACTM4|nr:YhgE/Pip domain-containing protein [Actinoplanes missouriensis]BAL92206.1 putative ABC transporter permease protein [Actinoplanes missouriensis 431]